MKRSRDKPRTSKGLFKDYKSEKKGLFDKKQSKVNEWDAVRDELKLKFLNAGIISCELQLDGCIKSYNFGFGWTFAHSLKRNKMATADDPQRAIDIRQVIYACVKCHETIEKLGNRNDEMYNIVLSTIAGRKIQPC